MTPWDTQQGSQVGTGMILPITLSLASAMATMAQISFLDLEANLEPDVVLAK